MRWQGKTFMVVLLLAGLGSAVAPPLPRFDAVSIKQLAPGKLSPFQAGLLFIGLQDPAEWRARDQAPIFIIMSAYGIGQYERSRIIGLPPWTHSADYLYDIEARVPPHAHAADIPLMVQAMLADRFQLKAHWKNRVMPAIALRVAPGGPKMQRDPACDDPDRPLALDLSPLVSGEDTAVWQASRNPGGCGSWMPYQANGNYVRVFHGFTMQQFAEFFSNSNQDLIVDQTGLKGAYDFTLTAKQTSTSGLTPEQMNDFRAQAQHDQEQAYRQQLGLSVDLFKTEKLPVRELVIDRIEKPTAN